MGNRTWIVATLFVVCVSTGCTIGPVCDPEVFAAYGGRWQRTNPSSGRVGSIIEPAGALVPYDGSPITAGTVEGAEPDASKEVQAADPPNDSSVLVPDELESSFEERQKALREKKLEDTKPTPLPPSDSI